MGMRAFNITLPADTNYRSLYSLVQAVTGWNPTNSPTPWKGYELIIGADTGIVRVSDSNFANCAGTPIQTNGSITFRSTVNSVSLREVFVSGNGLAISGWFSWT